MEGANKTVLIYQGKTSAFAAEGSQSLILIAPTARVGELLDIVYCKMFGNDRRPTVLFSAAITAVHFPHDLLTEMKPKEFQMKKQIH